MNVIRVNIISRIADDKNFFIDILYAVSSLKLNYNINIEVFFIGQIYNISIYNTLLRYSRVAGIEDFVCFTKCSIPLSEIRNISGDYFLNFSVGTFFGYSGLESMRLGFKTIFYNIDPAYSYECDSLIICKDVNDLVSLFKSIVSDNEAVLRKIVEENLLLLEDMEYNDSSCNSLLLLVK